MGDQTVQRNDWSCHSPSFLLAWGLPIAALVISATLATSWMPIIWPAAYLWMGAACLANSRRCGRVHCQYTGIFFLIVAVVSALHGIGVLGLGDSGWSWIGVGSMIGGAVLTVLPELILGRYRGPGAPPAPLP